MMLESIHFSLHCNYLWNSLPDDVDVFLSFPACSHIYDRIAQNNFTE